MIKIVGKGYKYLLLQLSDFLEITKTIVVSLKSVEGRKKYEKIFGKKVEDKKANTRVRTIHVNQSLLIDLICNLFEKSTSSEIIHDHFFSKSSNFKIIFIGHRLRNSLGRKLSILYQKPILNFGQFT
ncbi:MAG: hypothetical protein PHG79_12120 [Methanosarcina sp.]|nr:hypothetical protein [Methanosarcina sp.]MDD4523911.1 hypothetical protein [Methanosarcina sp.]